MLRDVKSLRRGSAITVAALVLLLAACGDDDDGGSAGAGADSGGEGAKVAYISPVAAQPGQQEINQGLEAGSEQLGWETTVLDANLSPDKQVAAVDTAISQQRDAIASWTLDPGATAGAYERANSAGIPVVGMNSEGPGVNVTVWWENVLCNEGGVADKEIEFITERIPKAKVILIGGPPAPSIVNQVKCFTAAAEKAGLQIIDKKDNTADTSDAAQKIMQDLLTKHPDVQVVWNYNDASALGVSAAIVAEGKKVATADEDGIIVIGHNGDKAAIEAVESGRMTGTWDPDNVASGMAAIKAMQTALDGGLDKKYEPLVVKSTFYTSETVGDWKPGSQRSYKLDALPLLPHAG
jgi:ribose transport system substrate-binding protein